METPPKFTKEQLEYLYSLHNDCRCEANNREPLCMVGSKTHFYQNGIKEGAWMVYRSVCADQEHHHGN